MRTLLALAAIAAVLFCWICQKAQADDWTGYRYYAYDGFSIRPLYRDDRPYDHFYLRPYAHRYSNRPYRPYRPYIRQEPPRRFYQDPGYWREGR